MKELSARAQALFDAARDADGPSQGDRDRIQARLTAALRASAFIASASSAAAVSGATAAGSGGAVTSSAAAGSGGAVAGGVVLAAPAGAVASAAGGGAASGWIAVLSAKSATWIGAAALSAALGTTPVVSTLRAVAETRDTLAPAADPAALRAQTSRPAFPLHASDVVAPPQGIQRCGYRSREPGSAATRCSDASCASTA